jgi:hypothetical protein
MKKTGKAGLGHHTKLEKISKQMAAGRAALTTKAELGKKAGRMRRIYG